jgi:heme A synthase
MNMNTAVMMERIREVSPRFKARMAGLLVLLVVLTAVFTEFIVRGRLSFAADLAAGIVEV